MRRFKQTPEARFRGAQVGLCRFAIGNVLDRPDDARGAVAARRCPAALDLNPARLAITTADAAGKGQRLPGLHGTGQRLRQGGAILRKHECRA